MLALTIHHNIKLTREQRYRLHDGENIEVVGVSVPVWFMGKTTSEPAKEVFCKYLLRNTKKEKPIKILSNGYEITLPNRPGSFPQEITDEEWRTMDEYQRSVYNAQFVSEVSSINLLDIKDGGSKKMRYREQNKVKNNDEILKIMHYIDIGDINEMYR